MTGKSLVKIYHIINKYSISKVKMLVSFNLQKIGLAIEIVFFFAYF